MTTVHDDDEEEEEEEEEDEDDDDDDDCPLTVSETSDFQCIPLMESQLRHVQFLPGCQLLLDHYQVDSGGLTLQVPRSVNWPATYSQTAIDAY